MRLVMSTMFLPYPGCATERIRIASNGQRMKTLKKDEMAAAVTITGTSNPAALGPRISLKFRRSSSVTEYEKPPQQKKPIDVGTLCKYVN